MSDDIFKATTAGVKTMADDTLRLTIDIEPRDAAKAFALFGVRGRSVAVTALRDGLGQIKEPPQAEKPKGGELAKLAGQWCERDDFVAFIRPVYDRHMGGKGDGWGDVVPHDFPDGIEGYCAHAVRVLCGVERSRSEIDHNPDAAVRFQHLIRRPFREWLERSGVAA